MSIWRRIRLSRKWLVLPPIFIGVGAVIAFAQMRKEIPRRELTELPRPLPVIRVEPREVIPKVAGFGTASASRRWGAVAEVQGRVVEIHPDLESGNAVGAGELLVRIDATDSQLVLSQRQADLESARAKLQELEAGYQSDQALLALAKEQVNVASRNEQRLASLQQTRVATESELDEAKSSRLAQEQALKNIQRSIALYPSQIGGAKASIALAEIKVREAERDIERTTIHSPFSGVLSGVDLVVGQFIGANEPLFELLDDQQIEVTAHFSIEQIEKLLSSSEGGEPRVPNATSQLRSERSENREPRPLYTARVTTRSGASIRTWIGRPVRIAESLNEQSRTLGVVVHVDNPPRVGDSSQAYDSFVSTNGSEENFISRASALRPGTFCEVVLQSPPRGDLITIPRTAMDGDSVYLVDGASRLRPRRVVAGFSFAGDVTILSGLSKGDVVAAVAPVPAIAGQLIDPRIDEADASQLEMVSSTVDSARAGAEERRQ